MLFTRASHRYLADVEDTEISRSEFGNRTHLRAAFTRWLPLLVILAFGGALRFSNLDWAEGFHFQPDESVHTIDYLLRLPTSLNPFEAGSFTYGHLPLYLYAFTARAFSFLTNHSRWLDKWHVTLIARTYAATASTLTIWLLYQLWARLNEPLLGLFSAALFSAAPLSVQYAHYGVVDTLLVFWVVLATLLALEAWRRDDLLWWFLTGLAVGLGAATKTSAVVWGSLFLIGAWDRWRNSSGISPAIYVLAVGGLGMLLAVGIGSPYYFLDWTSFRRIMAMQSAKTVTGTSLTTYHWQFLRATPFLYEMRQLGLWAVGLPAAVLGTVGLCRLGTRRDALLMLVLGAPLIYFATISLWHAKFIRYLLPVIPFLCFSAALTLNWLMQLSVRSLKYIAGFVIALSLLYSSLLGVSVSRIYAREDPRLVASRWIVENVSRNSRILHDPEPMILLPIGASDEFRIEILDLYGNRMQDINSIEWYVDSLYEQDYVVIVSKRNYGAIQNLSALFPVSACYYRMIFDGRLGYYEVAEFSNYPHLGVFVWNTDKAEETFQVFDHPVTRIYRRQVDLTRGHMVDSFQACLVGR
jgi:hypothetical protein